MAYRPSDARNQKLASSPQEPNMVPIMNLFLTIIPFLMLFVVLSNLALVSLNLSAGGGGGDGQEAGGGDTDVPKVQVYIYKDITDDPVLRNGFEIREPKLPPRKIPAINGRYNYVALDAALKEIKARRPNLGDINVAPNNDVMFEALLQTIDLCKKNGFPFVHYEVIETLYTLHYEALGGIYAA